MATLHLTDVPEHVYRLIQEKAETKQRSMSAEVIALLEEALASPRRKHQGEILDEIRRLRTLSPSPEEAGMRGSTALIREDRDR